MLWFWSFVSIPLLLCWVENTWLWCLGCSRSQRINRVSNLWVLTPQIFPYFKSSINPLTIKSTFSHLPLVKKKYYLVTIITTSNKIVCCMFKICLLSRKAPQCNNFPPVGKARIRVRHLWNDNNQIQKCKMVLFLNESLAVRGGARPWKRRKGWIHRGDGFASDHFSFPPWLHLPAHSNLSCFIDTSAKQRIPQPIRWISLRLWQNLMIYVILSE